MEKKGAWTNRERSSSVGIILNHLVVILMLCVWIKNHHNKNAPSDEEGEALREFTSTLLLHQKYTTRIPRACELMIRSKNATKILPVRLHRDALSVYLSLAWLGTVWCYNHDVKLPPIVKIGNAKLIICRNKRN